MNTLTRKECLMAAAKAFKEAIIRPKRPQDCFAEIIRASETIPEIDWFTENKWEDFVNEEDVDTRPCPLRDNFNLDKTFYQKYPKAESPYGETYTVFSAIDQVAMINGKVFGELSTIRKNVNGEMIGYIDIEAVKFDRCAIQPENSLVVISYCNENCKAAYEVLMLDKLLRFKESSGVDVVTPMSYYRYSGKVLQTITQAPPILRTMSDEDFHAMVARVHENCPEEIRHVLPENPATINHLANRTYYWVLEHNYMQGE